VKAFAGALILVLAAACSREDKADTPVNTTDTGAVTVPAGPGNSATVAGTAAPAITGGPTALGLTVAELDEADIVDANGKDLADVERVVIGPDGQVSQLVIEVDGTEPDLYVTMPLDGLVVVQNGASKDLRTNLTIEQLKALPVATRP